MATKSSRVSKRFLKEAETLEKSTFTSSSYVLRYSNGNEVAAKSDVNEDSDASLESSNIEEKNPRWTSGSGFNDIPEWSVP